jgi:hypothetical protein
MGACNDTYAGGGDNDLACVLGAADVAVLGALRGRCSWLLVLAACSLLVVEAGAAPVVGMSKGLWAICSAW